MRYINYLLIAFTSALCATYSVLWLTKPSPLESTTIPPLILNETKGEIVIWGGWKAVEGYQSPGKNAVEVRCYRELGTCNEALATILHHTEGEDLEAQISAASPQLGGGVTQSGLGSEGLLDRCQSVKQKIYWFSLVPKGNRAALERSL